MLKFLMAKKRRDKKYLFKEIEDPAYIIFCTTGNRYH
jgi:hypothetical protein